MGWRCGDTGTPCKSACHEAGKSTYPEQNQPPGFQTRGGDGNALGIHPLFSTLSVKADLTNNPNSTGMEGKQDSLPFAWSLLYCVLIYTFYSILLI